MDMGEPISLRKLGTIDCDLVETTPVVFHGKLLRFEYVRDKYKSNSTGDSYFRFVDVASGEPTSGFAAGYHLGCAHVEGDTVYAYGTDKWGGSRVQVFWSRDLENWESRPALEFPGWGAYNTSVCRGEGRYFMAIELGEPKELVGKRFTIFFAESDDLLAWRMLPLDRVHTRERYSASPAIRFLEGFYYMIYLEAKPGPTYEPHVVRSKDLVKWDPGARNPVMSFSEDDKRIASRNLTQEERDLIAGAVNINNSDVDLCEFEGRTVIYYAWGNQRGTEFLAEAVYDGPLDAFLRSFF
jgi:alpha-L-fucosidase